ncbi:glycosyl transferase family 2 [Halothece sp. PCC 7418]|uniref:glycosyltransferase family 2 protein n=1 Tax=Halothece sp. (strain PCC 7418) TaxID=65093 RepID=UPI0002A05C91|nr:glycosyltransferase family 2 protein [Halothece sp. PCC 7418]AFZ45118.1 glycosyl transferase family 2 [Halothece sp. PCC 7418]
MSASKLLSICIPAYNRPLWLKRALESITIANAESRDDIEIVVTDDSSSTECESVTQEVLQNWSGSWKYIYNQPRLGMAKNWNYSIQVASGEYVLVLHDDDFLLPNAITKIVKVIQRYKKQFSVFLFGVNVVNESEKIIKTQGFREDQDLLPQQAIQKLMSNSSFVRFPALVINRDLFEKVGYFNEKIGGVADLEMWIRIFSKHSILCLSETTAAYTVHEAALTTDMFNEEVIEKLLHLFRLVDDLNILEQRVFEDCKSNFFHQFILAGTYRQLKQGHYPEAVKIIDLFQNDSLELNRPSLKWQTIRFLFQLILRLYNVYS